MLTNVEFKDLGSKGLEKVLRIQYLYKYVNLSDALDYILKENTLKFSDPVDFNDPFDCSEHLIKIKIDKDSERIFFDEACLKHNIPRRYRRKQIKKLGKTETYTDALKIKKRDFRVSCFSEIPDEVLMWSHYADKHKGVCIKFELDIMKKDYIIYPVNYISEIQEIDGNANTPYVFYYLVTTKAARWNYEKEIRAITKTGNAIIPFSKESIKEVIFGCNVKESEIKKSVENIYRMGYKNIRFSKMELDPNLLGLKRKII
ncbi:hypothetical protein A5893_02275 [Pedobacter psychrophilus]|uniref:DUF2971 domain-containing protein n=1 Tax=Pedobacter psychrophilus TaxID=1826909 RepID=A0A179DLJ7_9SPHI|nr:DUF2971 domain-containing protein [Pedobacter psychrophilus]OAQ41966.1 hypothetical protein A5893_02275 [Pedobacter psychrophilus]